MADNTVLNTGAGGDTIATDDLTTLNGSGVSGFKAQRVKVGFGVDGTFQDVTPAAGLPIVGVQDSRSTGTITGAASVVGPNSVSSRNVVTVDVSGTYAGVTFIFEGSADGGTTWSGIQGVNNSTGQAGATWTPGTNATATYDFAVGGFTNVRVRATAWTSGTCSVGITPQVFAYDPAIAVIPQGFVAAGAAISGNPVLIGLSDGTNARFLLGDTAGRLAIGGAAASGAAIAGNPVMNGGTFTTTLPTVTTGQAVNMQCTARGEQLVAISSGATAVAVKAASTATAAADPALVVGLSPNMAATASAVNSAATTNATSVKASAGTVFSVTVSNTGGAAAFLKLYNKASAPTVGTDVPVLTIPIPASGIVPVNFGTFGYRFATGIALAITNLAADSDTTAVAANQVKVLTSYV